MTYFLEKVKELLRLPLDILLSRRLGMKILTWQARKDKKVTLVELAKLTGISKSTLNNIENMKVSPTMAEMEAIAKALNVKIGELYDSEYK